jgi:hypothetical protein
MELSPDLSPRTILSAARNRERISPGTNARFNSTQSSGRVEPRCEADGRHTNASNQRGIEAGSEVVIALHCKRCFVNIALDQLAQVEAV